VTALNKTRIGKPDLETLRLFNQCVRPLEHDLSIKPTKMYPVRKLVQDENEREFKALKTPISDYNAMDSQSSPDQNTQDLKYVLNDLQAPKGLKLRVGAQVMLLANLNVTEGLVNGSRGVVVEFVSMKEAIEFVEYEAMKRNAPTGEGSIAVAELRTFAQGNKEMQFPRVLFETKDSTKEVSPVFEKKLTM
jgi:ATP-dependent DNA helicase PIF1